jgi:hypothetical protein
VSTQSAGAESSSAIKVRLDFCDLGRIINGQPSDPVELRPFESAFQPEKIQASTKKLGLAPIDLRLAMQHPRVRDDSDDAARGAEVTRLIEQNASTLAMVSQQGIDVVPLQVPIIVKASPVSLVAGPSTAEERWKAVKEASGCAGAHWVAVGARAFNAPDVTGPAAERVAEKAVEAKDKKEQKDSDFYKVTVNASEIFDQLEGEGFLDLSTADAKYLVQFAHKAQKLKGVAQHTANRTAAISFLDGLGQGALSELLSQARREVVVYSANVVGAATPELLLTDQTAPDFADVSDLEDFQPVAAPEWLEQALEPGSSTADQLVGWHILYRWPPRLGGWMVGDIKAVNKDKDQTAQGGVCNYVVYYRADKEEAFHRLQLSSYATSSKAKVDSWVMLTPK